MSVVTVVLLLLAIVGEVVIFLTLRRAELDDKRREHEQMAELRKIQSLHAQAVKGKPTSDEG